MYDSTKIQEFLTTVKSIMKTEQLTILPRTKNIAFMQKYKIKHRDAICMVEQLELEDCYSVEPNNNPRYAEAEVYKFKRKYDLRGYKEDTESVVVYIKMYLMEKKTYDDVVAISFHRDGEID